MRLLWCVINEWPFNDMNNSIGCGLTVYSSVRTYRHIVLIDTFSKQTAHSVCASEMRLQVHTVNLSMNSLFAHRALGWQFKTANGEIFCGFFLSVCPIFVLFYWVSIWSLFVYFRLVLICTKWNAEHIAFCVIVAYILIVNLFESIWYAVCGLWFSW